GAAHARVGRRTGVSAGAAVVAVDAGIGADVAALREIGRTGADSGEAGGAIGTHVTAGAAVVGVVLEAGAAGGAHVGGGLRTGALPVDAGGAGGAHDAATPATRGIGAGVAAEGDAEIGGGVGHAEIGGAGAVATAGRDEQGETEVDWAHRVGPGGE